MSARVLQRPAGVGIGLRLLLAAPFACGVAAMATDFAAAEAAVRGLGLPLPGAVVVMAIVAQAGGVALLLSARSAAAGAIVLAAFALACASIGVDAGAPAGTLAADMLAVARQLAIVGGLLLLARSELHAQGGDGAG